MLVSGEVACPEFGEVSSGDGEPVLKLSAPLGSTFRGVVCACVPSLAPLKSLKAGLIVISGFEECRRASPGRVGDLGPDLTVKLSPALLSLSSRSFSCHSRA